LNDHSPFEGGKMTNSLYVGTRKGLFQWRRDEPGGAWYVHRTEFLGVQIPIVHPATNGQIYVAQQHGHFGAKLQRSTDEGATWQELTTPSFPPKPADVADVMEPMHNKPIFWSIELLWSLAHDGEGRLWCGTIPGGLFSSDDDGQSWQLNEALWSAPERAHWFGGGYDWPGIHSICVDPNDAQKLTLGISCGGVWRTTDRGNHWTCLGKGMRAEYMPPDRQFDPTIQDPHLLAQCQADPTTFWTQHHNGIFRSVDDCETWTELPPWEPSTFGFAVASHPQDPNTAWFVPAISDEVRYPAGGQFVVTRTRDGGQTHQVLSDGLPQDHAYHLVFRHALAISDDGHTLAMGSTTGGLWVTDDGGDHWQQITQDLPPIYCVEFGATI
jgi:photosystem II stability/assembly factor-like uncharacterized protein